jgi:hypothetical protein
LEIVEGDFFLRNKPLRFQDSVKTRIENAVAAKPPSKMLRKLLSGRSMAT